MSKNLNNIPKQDQMTEQQEQTFTNGINKGRKLEQERIIKLLENTHTDYWKLVSTKIAEKTVWEYQSVHDDSGCKACKAIALIKENN